MLLQKNIAGQRINVVFIPPHSTLGDRFANLLAIYSTTIDLLNCVTCVGGRVRRLRKTTVSHVLRAIMCGLIGWVIEAPTETAHDT